MQLITILSLTFGSSILSLIGSFLLSLKKNWPKRFVLQMTAFSSGTLLATALLHLAPESLEELGSETFFPILFGSIVLFFVLERLVLWHHHHEEDAECGPKPSVILISISDSLHNFIDGVLIAGTFVLDPALGVLTAVAVAAHEIPQEIADFSIMVAGGMRRTTALLVNILSAVLALVGAVVAYFFITTIENIVPYVVGFSAGMFLYIALSDLIPELHSHDLGKKQKSTQLALFFVGVALIMVLGFFEVE